MSCALLQSGIQMNIDADDHGEERIPLSGMNAHAMQMVIIKHPVIHPFAGSTVVVNCFIFFRASGDRSIEPDIPVRFGIDTPAIGGWGTFPFTRAGIHSAAGKRAAPLTGVLLFTVSPVDHTETSHAQGSAVFVNGDGIRDGFRPAAFMVQVNKGPDFPFPAKTVGGIVVIGRIQADVTDRDIWVDGFKFAEGDNGGDTVMPPGIHETDMKREVNSNVCIMGAEHIKCMAEIKNFLVAVPSPVGIGIREMAPAGAVCASVLHTVTDFMSIRGGMGMDTGAVAGKGEAVRREEPVFQGRDEGGKPEELLKPVFIMKGKFFM